MSHAVTVRSHAGSLHAPQLDGGRIVATAGTIAVNAVLIALLMVPLARYSAPEIEEAMTVVDIAPVKPVEPEPPERDPEPQQAVIDRRTPDPTPSLQQAPADIPSFEPVVDSLQGDEAVVAADTSGMTDIGSDSLQPLSGAVLQTLSAPAPDYPREAMRQGLGGTVELEILVGIDGRPLDVRIVRSSGHRVLDQAARRAVLASWTFKPALRNGRPVQAMGRVPIDFRLAR